MIGDEPEGAPLLPAPCVRVAVVVAPGRPVAAATAVLHGGAAGVYWVATRVDARRRGFGACITRHVVAQARDAGASPVVLQATALGPVA